MGSPLLPAEAATATVVRVDARQCEILRAGESEVRAVQMRGRLWEKSSDDKSPVAVGDQVRLELDEDGEAIAEVLPRRNAFARRAAGEDVRRQVLATNVDQVVLVACFGTPPFSSITTDRILATASFADIPTTLVLNKIDRSKPRKIEEIAGTYQKLDMQVLLTSAETGDGCEALTEALVGKVSVFYGLSGVGKSSLLNRVEDGLGIRTREVSESLKSGRHTTTYARLYRLAAGGAVIDTPGARTFRPWGIPPHELRLHYKELREIGPGCRFPACLHRDEPDCAVLAAAERGEITASRMRSYHELLAELQAGIEN
ncbi:MAG: ribosome small subunit-dependent GTPase A [Planctomycetes bacterium]|nr:ribosome small subunit-dependent GTPase A [Planctomycetota bacterium]